MYSFSSSPSYDLPMDSGFSDYAESPGSPSYSPPLPLSSVNSCGYSDFVDEMSDLASFIDNFADVLDLPLKPTVSGGSHIEESFSFFNPSNVQLSNIKVEKPLSIVTSAPSPSNKLNFKVPSIELPESIQSSNAYFPQPIPNQPGQYIASQFPPAPVRTVKRKRAAIVDEDCSTDGVLFEWLKKACSNKKVPILIKEVDEESRALFTKNRATAKLKLDVKKRLRKFNFSGHYPERKAVACARKRVGGRFVNENKSVFRPAKQNATTV